MVSKKQLPAHHPSLTTISSWLQENTKILADAGINSAHLDCKILLETVLHKSRTWLAAHGDEMLLAEDYKKLDTFITQRKNRVPLAYIIGSKEFYGRLFLVNESVLIPRPESESMIEVLKEVMSGKWMVDSRQMSAPKPPTPNPSLPTIYDIGTGSGCLAITVKLELPHTTVIATDISPEALRVAKKNARLHHANIIFQQANLLQTIDSQPLFAKATDDKQQTIILANLPYVPEGYITSKEITKEPAIALFSGADGLNHYRALFQSLKTKQNKPFVVITESLILQHTALVMIAKEAGYHLKKTTGLIQHFSVTES